MTEINEFLWGGLYALKQVYDHNPDAPVLAMYRDDAMDGDYVYEICINALDQFFADTRNYCDEEKGLDVHVFFDPLIEKTWILCEKYERQKTIAPKDNALRQELLKGLYNALYVGDYSYDARVYSDTGRRGGCRIVLLLYEEFCGHHLLPGILAEVYTIFEECAGRLADVLGNTHAAKTVTAPFAEKEAD